MKFCPQNLRKVVPENFSAEMENRKIETSGQSYAAFTITTVALL
jgi:hypothetical protein